MLARRLNADGTPSEAPLDVWEEEMTGLLNKATGDHVVQAVDFVVTAGDGTRVAVLRRPFQVDGAPLPDIIVADPDVDPDEVQQLASALQTRVDRLGFGVTTR
jgi:hypothetical protein